MAVRRAKSRRRNAGAPTSGALLVNPRRRKRKTTTKRRRTNAKHSTARKNRMSATKRRAAARKAALTRKRNAAKRSRAAKKAAATRRRNGTKKGMTRRTARKAYMTKRRNPTRRRRAPARKRVVRRRNTANGRKKNILSGVQQSVKRVPVVGGMLSDVVGLGVPAAFGAVSILPIEFGLKAGGRFLPPALQKVSFTIGGMVMGALFKRFAPVSPATRDKFAIALATAGGAVDFYRHRTGQGTVQAMEAAESAGFGAQLGELEIMDGFGELEIMDGFGAYGDMGYDIVNFPEAGDWSESASLADAFYAGGDFTDEEVYYALAGPRRFGKRFGAGRFRKRASRAGRSGSRSSDSQPSSMAGKPGLRWGWLRKLVGKENFQKVAALPADQRRSVIESLKSQAVSSLPNFIEAESNSGNGSASSSDGFGAYLYAG